ncbi:flagellar basal body P-ring formation protein FlgA [Desulfohalobiaceae bacterium Ax17]|uniref:flagellar basal body P-ring formation chaperone FlgA n=1 Tax=Desulfovulcanus ferrireducens TaxID=2831190 RepID=UPI00207BBE88|nr:flagellar basal body P-ring formation chaperone FlgA [Desulfovulcanus ferrireducens]MBT8763785.1 flagellar basal body P-ring formation protein FlgA [Desulfovulcanus ferrireducens]
MNLTKPIIISLLLVVNCFLMPGQGLAQVKEGRFWIKEWVAVQGERVRFGEIAVPEGEWAQKKWSELKDVLLWPVPAKKMMVIPRQRLLTSLTRFLGDIASVCFLPKQIVIKQAAGGLGKEILRKKIVTFLTDKVKALGGEVNFRDFRLPNVIFWQKNESVRIELMPDVKPGRNSLRLLVEDAFGNLVKSYTGTVFIDVWKAVPCAAKPLNRKEVVYPSTVRFEKKNLAYVHGQVWNGQGGPWRVKSPVGKGQILVMSNLEPVPTISRGEKVNLKFQGQFVSLVVPAMALEDGNLGQSILVKNLQSKNQVLAKVVDKNTVVVD